MSIWGERIRKAREQANLTQEELAKQVRVNLNTVWRWENGEREPRKNNLTKIASVLSISLDDLYLMGEDVSEARADRVRVGESEEARRKGQPSASVKDFAHTRELAKNVESLGDHDLNAAEEMLLASLESIRKEKAIRAAQQDGVAM